MGGSGSTSICLAGSGGKSEWWEFGDAECGVERGVREWWSV